MDRQELLVNLLKNELGYLKKKCFKYQHRPFLERKLVIKYGGLDGDIAGRYEIKEGLHRYDYTHEITIDNRVIDYYVNCKQTSSERLWGYDKKYYKNQLKQVIRHELIHAFVEERYTHIIDISGVCNDASSIFLSVLFWCGGSSSHRCAYAFKKSELYNKIKEFKTFDEFDLYLCTLLLEFQSVCKTLKAGAQIKDNLVINDFMFANREAGLVKFHQSKYRFVNKTNSDIRGVESNIFLIGCNIMPQQINSLVAKKRSGNFEKYEYKKVATAADGSTVKVLYAEVSGM